MPRCKNCDCYYSGDENTPRGLGWCASADKKDKKRKGCDKEWYINDNGKWRKTKKISPKMDREDLFWTKPEYIERIPFVEKLMIDDKIDDNHYNLSGKNKNDVEIRYTYTYPNKFETDSDGLRYTFDIMSSDKTVVPYGTHIWIHISNLLDDIKVKYKHADFIFENLEGYEGVWA